VGFRYVWCIVQFLYPLFWQNLTTVSVKFDRVTILNVIFVNILSFLAHSMS